MQPISFGKKYVPYSYATPKNSKKSTENAKREDVTANSTQENSDIAAMQDASTAPEAAQEAQREEATTPLDGFGQQTNKFKISTSKPEDPSPALTRRLVIATTSFEVRQLMAEASRSLMSLRMIAATGEKEDQATAQQYIKKIEKFLKRSQKKIKSLSEEDKMQAQKAVEENNAKNENAKKIEKELRQKKHKRQNEEQRYLLETELQTGNVKSSNFKNPSSPLDAASEAQIALQAKMLAQKYAAMATVSSDSSQSESAELAVESFETAAEDGAALQGESVSE